MVPLLAKNAIKIKCTFPHACMTGNYECAYALGILCATAGIPEITEYHNMIDLKEKVMQLTSQYQTEDAKVSQLIKILNEYEATDVFDDQMKDLYRMGIIDKNL